MVLMRDLDEIVKKKRQNSSLIIETAFTRASILRNEFCRSFNYSMLALLLYVQNTLQPSKNTDHIFIVHPFSSFSRDYHEHHELHKHRSRALRYARHTLTLEIHLKRIAWDRSVKSYIRNLAQNFSQIMFISLMSLDSNIPISRYSFPFSSPQFVSKIIYG